MITSFLLLAALTFCESKTLAVQIHLDRAGYSCNTIDGQWGRKSERALRRYLEDRHLPVSPLPTPESAFDTYFDDGTELFRVETVSEADLAALIRLPADPFDKAKLKQLGYESIKEMFAERGHVSPRALERLNPGVDWANVRAGLRLVIPDFPPIAEELSVWPKGRARAPKRPEAAVIRVSLSNFEVLVLDGEGRTIGLFPCSIAKDKAKLPPQGELKLVQTIARPDYTYTPDFTPAGQRPKRCVLPEGPNSPIGVAWLGLNLPGYGLHGTPHPESIGNAESHGCFRLANWNAARLYAFAKPGTPVIVTR